ncbi:hypothetical protein X777_09613, partial [Ooceraea biroi]
MQYVKMRQKETIALRSVAVTPQLEDEATILKERAMDKGPIDVEMVDSPISPMFPLTQADPLIQA